MRLLLFDIDGTLISGDQAGRLAMAAALEDVFGTRGSLDELQFGGKTDSAIVVEALAGYGIPVEIVYHKLPDVFKSMAQFAGSIYPQRNMIPCPGVDALLTCLRDCQDVLLGLLTGNAESTAHLKLRAAGIDPGQFVLGAFGSDDSDRNNLPGIALSRAGKLTEDPVTVHNAVIIGDTPADVQCARAGGVKAVAVASGWHSADTLRHYQPDHLFDDLRDTEAVLRVLLN